MKSKLAIWGFILSLIGAAYFVEEVYFELILGLFGNDYFFSFLPLLIFGAIGFILSRKGLKEIKQNKFSGIWFSRVGLILSSLILIYSIFIVAFFLL